jgi:hypothetical protein
MRYRLFTVAILAAFVGAFVVAPASQTAAQPNRGTVDATMVGGGLEGAVSNLVATFDRATGNLNISGLFEGTLNGEDLVTDFTATLIGGSQQGDCQILFLDVGPIFLDLLGLQVDVSQIIIDVTAVPGPGNLLGNLLCAVAGLLDRGGPLQGIANLLNNLFRNL